MPQTPFASQSIVFISHNQRAEITKYFLDQSIAVKNNPDVLMIESEKALGIDDVRKLQSWAMDKPYAHEWKVAVLLAAETLTPAAQNAMLKILEEPPAHTYIVLVATGDQRLLPTVLSRCQIIVDTTDDKKETAAQFPKTAQEALAKIDELAKLRADAVKFCTDILNDQQRALETSPTIARIQSIKKLCRSLDLLQHNVNTRLVLEELFEARLAARI